MRAEPSMEGLLQAVAQGDRSAFRRLHDRVSPKLFGVALRICRNRTLAEDALQDALVDIWSRAGSFDPVRGRAEAWMVAVLRNRAIDRLRRQSRAPLPADEPEAAEKLSDVTPTGDAAVEFMALAACLGQLQEEIREAVLLAYYLGLSREELARRFAVPVNTMKTRLRRALAALRECLDK